MKKRVVDEARKTKHYNNNKTLNYANTVCTPQTTKVIHWTICHTTKHGTLKLN
ncbi:hypothetical protein Hanom_Chr11g00975721 [Helianthus anomalus]